MKKSFGKKENYRRSGIGRLQVDIKSIKRAIKEDAPEGDVTSKSIIPKGQICRAKLIAKQDMVLSGRDMFTAVFKTVDPDVTLSWKARDGARVESGFLVAGITGRARSVLLAERVALNYIQRMCAVATLTSRYVVAVSGTGTIILDTRKTAPGFRELDKYAVRCGGGDNHRRDLSEMVLIKENHIIVAGGVAKAIVAAREGIKQKVPIIVEAASLDDVREACSKTPDRILFDNMTPAQIKRALKLVPKGVRTEASGGITLKNIKSYANAGVGFISVGALTHSVTAADLSLLVEM